MDSRISSFVQQDQLVYWYALAFMQGVVKGHKSLTTERKNSIYIAAYKHTPRLSLSLSLSIVDLFELIALGAHAVDMLGN